MEPATSANHHASTSTPEQDRLADVEARITGLTRRIVATARLFPDEEALGGVMQEGVAPDLVEEVCDALEQVGGSHPQEAQWYLPAIGVDPRSQGAASDPPCSPNVLATIDEQHVAACLESTNPRNVPLYERFGFSDISQIRAGTSSAIIPMLRSAR